MSQPPPTPNSADAPDAETAAFVRQMAQVLDLPLDPAHFPGVVENFALLQQVAAQVMPESAGLADAEEDDRPS